MNTLKVKSLFIALALFTTSVPTVAFAAIQAGSKCTVYGKTKVSIGKTYKCVKSGKKLVWNKGVVVAIPSPTTSAAVKEIPVALWQEIQFKLLEQFKNLKPKTIQQVNFVLSPNIDKSLAKTLQDSYLEPLTYLSNLFVTPSQVTILVMNENDRDWWTNKTKELDMLMPTSWWNTNCPLKSTPYCAYTSPNKNGTFHVGTLMSSDLIWRELNTAKTYHESIHIYQLGLMGNRMEALPSWFAEGQANYLGYTFSHRFIDSRQQRNSETWRLRAWPNVEKFDDKQWFEWIQKVESDRTYTNEGQLGYSLGELILEALYNQHDFRKVHDWMVAIKNGSDYKTGFKSVFGQEYDSWLRDTVAPYLNSQI